MAFKLLCHKDIWGSGGIAPPVLTSALGGSEWSASKSLLLYHEGKGAWHPLNKRLGGPQYQSGCCGEEKNVVVHCKSTDISEEHVATFVGVDKPSKDTSMKQVANKLCCLFVWLALQV
jgi:hypothetical protein